MTIEEALHKELMNRVAEILNGTYPADLFGVALADLDHPISSETMVKILTTKLPALDSSTGG